MSDDFLKMDQVAEELGISVRAVRAHCLNGKLGSQPHGPGTKWLITRSQLEAFKLIPREVGNPNFKKKYN